MSVYMLDQPQIERSRWRWTVTVGQWIPLTLGSAAKVDEITIRTWTRRGARRLAARIIANPLVTHSDGPLPESSRRGKP